MHAYNCLPVWGHKSELVWDLYIVHRRHYSIVKTQQQETKTKKTTHKTKHNKTTKKQTKQAPGKRNRDKKQIGKLPAIQFSKTSDWVRGPWQMIWKCAAPHHSSVGSCGKLWLTFTVALQCPLTSHVTESIIPTFQRLAHFIRFEDSPKNT